MTSTRLPSAAQRAAYRRWIRDNHPDVGGDAETFAAGLARYRKALRADPGHYLRHDRYDAPIVIVSNSDHLRRTLARLRRRLQRQAPTRVR